MRMGKRMLAVFTLLVAGVVLLLCLTLGIGIWVVKEPATTKAIDLFGRVDGKLDIAEQSLGQMKASLARAGDRLESVREEQRKLAQEPRKGTAVGRLIGRTVQRQVAPEIGNAHEKLHTVAEAAVVVNAVLEDVGNLPFLSIAGLDTARITDMNSRLADVGPAAWELSRLLGESTPEADAEAGNQLNRIDQAVKSLQGLVGDYEAQITGVRQRAGDIKARTLAWITPAAILISFLCFWIALSQVCLMSRALYWLK